MFSCMLSIPEPITVDIDTLIVFDFDRLSCSGVTDAMLLMAAPWGDALIGGDHRDRICRCTSRVDIMSMVFA